MKPAQVNLPTIWRGADYAAIMFNWKDASGNPINLTGWQFFAQSDQFDLNPQMVNAATGVTSVSLTNAQTAVLKLGTANWNCWFVYSNGIVTPPLLAGKVPIKEKNSFP